MNNPPQSFEEALDSVLEDLRETMIRKQNDYGPGNISEFGELGCLVRATDKYKRLKNLLYDNPDRETQNESLEDSWIDWANYGIIALMVRRGIWGLPTD